MQATGAIQNTEDDHSNSAEMIGGGGGNDSVDKILEDSEGKEKREIVDMILVSEDSMNQLIYANRKGFFVYNEEDDKSIRLRQVQGGHTSSVTSV